MTLLSTIYNNNFLNNLFTSKKFKFINHLNLDKTNIDSMIRKENENRDSVVTFLNNLHEAISNGNLSEQSEETSKLFNDLRNVFELLNQNITLMQNIKEMENTKSHIILNDIKIDNFFKQKIGTFSIDLKSNISKEGKNSGSYTPEYTIPDNTKESNSTLLISEKEKKVFLPYTKNEVLKYLEQYPGQYSSFKDVINKEFIFHFDFYMKHPVIARFREVYALIRDRESKSIFEAFKLAMDLMFNYDLNPAIIAACKSQEQLEDYLDCLDRKKLDQFNDFEIRFELSPLKT